MNNFLFKKINWKILIFCFLIVFGVAFIGSLFTSQSVNSEWYDSIKPSITSPSFVFPIVWNILFFLIALSLYFVWINSKEKKKIILLFGFNFVLNILWSVFYFGLRNPLSAFIVIIFLLISIISLILSSRKINKFAFFSLIPYFVWVSFASVLNFLSL
jgi:tryptophan-rich sensory protein